MDPLSIPDRLQSPTPVRNIGSHGPTDNDPQRHRRQRPDPKPDLADEPADSQETEDSHQLDELA